MSCTTYTIETKGGIMLAIVRFSMYLLATLIMIQLILQGNLLVLLASVLYILSYIGGGKGEQG